MIPNRCYLAVALCMYGFVQVSNADEQAPCDVTFEATAPIESKPDDRWQVFTKITDGKCTIYEGVVKSISTEKVRIARKITSREVFQMLF